MPRALLVPLFLLASVTAFAQPRTWWPGSTYYPAIPTPKAVLGYEMGDDYTEHGDMLAYMRRLEASSKRVKVFSVGATNERREIILVTVSAPENMARLEEIRTAVARFRDPRAIGEAQVRDIAVPGMDDMMRRFFGVPQGRMPGDAGRAPRQQGVGSGVITRTATF